MQQFFVEPVRLGQHLDRIAVGARLFHHLQQLLDLARAGIDGIEIFQDVLDCRFRSVRQLVHQALDVLFADLGSLALFIREIDFKFGEVLLRGSVIHIRGIEELHHRLKLAFIAQIAALHDPGDGVVGDVEHLFGGRRGRRRDLRLDLLDP